MARMIAPLFILSASPALAHPGFHPNPHWVGSGWLVAALIGALAAPLLRTLRK
jgi:hypothetical protein